MIGRWEVALGAREGHLSIPFIFTSTSPPWLHLSPLSSILLLLFPTSHQIFPANMQSLSPHSPLLRIRCSPSSSSSSSSFHRRRPPPSLRASSDPPSSSLIAPPPPPPPAASHDCLLPRVEEQHGFWVLKPDARTAINPVEKMKLEKDPMKFFMEGGIKELAKKTMEEIDSGKEGKDDIDSRLKWLGLFHRRKHQYGRFMMRLKVVNGVMTSEQMEYVAGVVERYGEEGCADVTTRQSLQIRGVVLPDAEEIMEGLAGVGLSSLQSGMDNVRNVVGNPLAGIDPDEILDTRPFTAAINRFLTAAGRGNPAFSNLPRKWNACVVGSHDQYEHPHINDLAYIPATNPDDGRLGFNLLVGGFISPKRSAEAVPLDAWVPADENSVVHVCAAILEAYRDLGNRGNRHRTRMMWLIDELGVEGFRAEVERRLQAAPLLRAAPKSAELPRLDWRRRRYFGAHPQKQPDLSFVGLHVPVGRLQAADLRTLAGLARRYSVSRELRLTVEQNVIVADVPTERVGELLAELAAEGGVLSASPADLASDLVACTGSQFCGQALIETKARAKAVAEELERRVMLSRPVRMHWTGCPNSCAQVQVADIGLMGCMVRSGPDRKLVEGVDIYLGGRVGADSHLGDLVHAGVPCSDVVPLLQDLLIQHFGATSISPAHPSSGK